jgi:putative membrane protein
MTVHVETLAVAALLAGAWLAAHRGRWCPAGVRASPVRAAAFGLGLAAALIALNGPVHDLAERSHFSAHMAQHLLLALVVPPLLLAGTPAWLMDGLLTVVLRRRGLPAARAVTRPVPALALYTVVLVVWHLPGPFDAALASHAWHIVEHAALVSAALVAWWPVLGPSRLVAPLPHAAQILYLFAFGMPMTVVAAMITGADDVLYPFYAGAAAMRGVDALADQRLGGVLMWVPAGVVPLVAFTIVFFRWAAIEADE